MAEGTSQALCLSWRKSHGILGLGSETSQQKFRYWCNETMVFGVAPACGCIAYSGVGVILLDYTALTWWYHCIGTLVTVNLRRWTCQ